MHVYPDGSVTGSVDVAELEEIHKAQKAAGKRRTAAVGVVETLAEFNERLESDPDAEAAETPPKSPAKTTKEK
jgi:hypothetical protein